MTIGSWSAPLRLLHHTGGGGYEGTGGGGGRNRRRDDGNGGGGGNGDPCDIEIETVLQSVKVELLRSVTVGRVLPITVEMENGSERLCVNHDGKIVGSIVSPFATEIIECMQKGNNYQATVTEIHGNLYRVRIKKK